MRYKQDDDTATGLHRSLLVLKIKILYTGEYNGRHTEVTFHRGK